MVMAFRDKWKIERMATYLAAPAAGQTRYRLGLFFVAAPFSRQLNATPVWRPGPLNSPKD
jgi:hypothetical protein